MGKKGSQAMTTDEDQEQSFEDLERAPSFDDHMYQKYEKHGNLKFQSLMHENEFANKIRDLQLQARFATTGLPAIGRRKSTVAYV